MASSKSSAATAALAIAFLLVTSLTPSAACGSCMLNPPPAAPAPESCPRDTLKLGACINLLGLNLPVIGEPVSSKCCPLLQGLADLEAAVCLCTTIKASVLNLNIPVALSLLVSACQKTVPPGFQCT